MRITIESTDSEPQFSSKSIVELPYDDVDLNELLQLFTQAAAGFGFPPDSLAKLVNPEEE